MKNKKTQEMREEIKNGIKNQCKKLKKVHKILLEEQNEMDTDNNRDCKINFEPVS